MITEMIARTCNNVRRGAAASMIYYGYAVALVSLANFALLYLLYDPVDSFKVWWLMLPVTAAGFIIQARIDRSALALTQIDRIVSAVWRGFFISTVTLLAILFAMAAVLDLPVFMLLTTPGIMLLMGAAQYATGRACRFAPFVAGAWVFWIGALLAVACALMHYGPGQFLVLAVCMAAGFVAPGHMLNRKASGNV